MSSVTKRKGRVTHWNVLPLMLDCLEAMWVCTLGGILTDHMNGDSSVHSVQVVKKKEKKDGIPLIYSCGFSGLIRARLVAWLLIHYRYLLLFGHKSHQCSAVQVGNRENSCPSPQRPDPILLHPSTPFYWLFFFHFLIYSFSSFPFYIRLLLSDQSLCLSRVCPTGTRGRGGVDSEDKYLTMQQSQNYTLIYSRRRKI